MDSSERGRKNIYFQFEKSFDTSTNNFQDLLSRDLVEARRRYYTDNSIESKLSTELSAPSIEGNKYKKEGEE